LISIIIMGGATEYVLLWLNIPVDVDEEAYMEKWREERALKGAFHDFEYDYVYIHVVREANNEESAASNNKNESSTDPETGEEKGKENSETGAASDQQAMGFYMFSHPFY